MADNYNPIFTFLAVDIYYLHDIGKKYFYCAKKLFEENNPQESLQPFCLLATTAAELFLKVIITSNICKELKGLEKDDTNIKTVIIEELKCYGHNIKKLIEKSQIKDEFKISQLEEASNGFVNDYRFIIAEKLICFKDSESVRFGSLAKKQDLAQSVQFHFSAQIVDFLDKLSYFSFSEMNKVVNTFRGSNESKSS